MPDRADHHRHLLEQGSLAETPLPQFRSGLYLAQWIHTYSQVRDQLPRRRFQYAVPGLVRRHMGSLTHRDVVRLRRTAAAAVVAAEIALPPALLIPQTTS